MVTIQLNSYFTRYVFGFREEGDVLAVCDWNQRLSFYHLNGKPVRK
jgi:hypothetical protein